MVRPTTCKELRRFIGMVNYYSDMWVRILLGYKIIVHTDHTKLAYTKSTSDRVMRWRLL
jgi:hypothetical protein